MLAAAAAACSPLSRRRITLGGVGAGVGVRTVIVAVQVASGYTVTFWMTSSARNVHACDRTRDVIASAGYAYVVIQPASPRMAFHLCVSPSIASHPNRRSSSDKSVAVATFARNPWQRSNPAMRCATEIAAVPTVVRQRSAWVLSMIDSRMINQVSRRPAYGGVPISESYTRG